MLFYGLVREIHLVAGQGCIERKKGLRVTGIHFIK